MARVIRQLVILSAAIAGGPFDHRTEYWCLPFRAKRPPILRCEGRNNSQIERGTLACRALNTAMSDETGASGAAAQWDDEIVPTKPLIPW